MAAAANPRARSAVATEAGTLSRGPVGAPVMDSYHLEVDVIPAAVRVLVFDAGIREMHLLVEVRQVVLAGPFLDLMCIAIGVAVVVVAVAIARVQPLLVVALELVVEDDAIDARAALPQAFGFAFEGAIDLD